MARVSLELQNLAQSQESLELDDAEPNDIDENKNAECPSNASDEDLKSN